MVVDRVASPGALQEHIEEAQKSQAGYAVAIVGITRHLLNSSQYCSLVRTLEIERDCRTLLLTPTLETHDTPLSGLSSGHLTKPVCRDAFYDELLLLIHGIQASNRGAGEVSLPLRSSGPSRVPRVLAVDDNDANLVLGIIANVIMVATVIFSLPAILAGIGLFKRKEWARILTLIFSVINLIVFWL